MPGLFGALARGLVPMTRASAGVPSYGLIPPLGSISSASGLMISQATAMSVGAVYRAINVRATDIARCKASLFTEAQDGTRTKIKEHPVAHLMHVPNRVQTWFEFVRDM
jgi:phage portal protein BeeE